MASRFEITGGPSKFDLMLALFTGQAMLFDIPNIRDLKVRISVHQLCTHEGSSPENWEFQGWSREIVLDGKSRFVKGSYSTRSRNGSLEAHEPNPESEMCI